MTIVILFMLDIPIDKQTWDKFRSLDSCLPLLAPLLASTHTLVVNALNMPLDCKKVFQVRLHDPLQALSTRSLNDRSSR
jgi:hypothetical protein